MNKPTNEYIMAIKPEWVALIESKEKTLEIRRTAPYISPPVSENNPIDVWVYETKKQRRARPGCGPFPLLQYPHL